MELSEEVGPEMYLPEAQFTGPLGEERWVILRAAGNPLQLTTAIRDAVRRLDPSQPIADMVSLDQMVDRSTAARRFNMWLISLFAGLAFGLALIGIYGVTAYTVSQRTRELGIRLALGAARGDVIRLLLGEGLWLAGAGTTIGLGLAIVTTRLLASMLYAVPVTDPFTFAGSGALLIAAALLATWIPARRAAGVDPLIALRAE
jgi:putative ABC transport system permease protein